ncbi:MAG: FHA domain-containing protein [Lachnospiraceae bacterium]|nr:FHA domain-containing protein [Lachnospiraceae bacterium]
MVIRGMSGNFAGQDFQVNGSLVFGRSQQGCNVLFPDNVKGVSRNHCKVESNGVTATITDIGSSYGTFVNGRKLAPYTPTTLNNGDTFWLGDRANSFSFMGAPAAQPMNMGTPQMNVQPIHMGVPNQGGMSKNKRTGIIIAAVAAGIVILILAGALISKNNEATRIQAEKERQEAEFEHEKERQQDIINNQNQKIQEQQSAIDNEKNKGPLEKIIEGADAAIGLFN